MDMRQPKHADSMQWVRALLKRTGMKQQQLADALGVEPTMVRKWATGVNRPDWNNTLRLTDILMGAEKRNVDPMEVALVELFRRLPIVRRAQLVTDLVRELDGGSANGPAPQKS